MPQTGESNAPVLSFFGLRMQQIGVTDSNSTIIVENPEAEFPQPSKYKTPVFTEDKTTGDIEILYYRINGELIQYEHVTDAKTGHINAKTRLYKTRRIKDPKGDMKYQMPAGQPTLPWFPPSLVEKYNEGSQVPTLILTEGVFKAMCGSIAGLDVVGLASITCYKDRNGKLYEDIVLLIERCNVQNVVILWDADCLQVGRKDLQVGDELTQRPNTFYSSARKIAELVTKLEFGKTREKVNVFFSHVKYDSLPERPKGLDDLILAGQKQGREARIVQEAANPTKEQFFFFSLNITNSSSAMLRHFRLNTVEDFYTYHEQVIDGREFKFKGSTYRWSDKKESLEIQAPEWADRLIWVGDEFFMDDTIPGVRGALRRLLPYQQGTLSKLFGKDFWSFLPQHRVFVNIPDHFNYRRVVEMEDGSRYYNRYFPFPHVPKEGKWPTIQKLLLHLFGTEGVKHARTGQLIQPVELALDYIQILLTDPKQMLPILCFYSPENNTGKSTFGKLMMAIFGDNVIPGGNSDLQTDFNELYSDKLLFICEETLLERKRDAERIKALSTSDKITVNPKGSKQYTIDFFCKFIFTSNNLRMIYVSKHDQRYWIIQVPVLTEENPNMLEEMKEEIPAFINFLKNRQLATEKEGRMWFHPSLIRTRIQQDMVRVNEPSDATNLRETVREWFMQDHNIKELQMTMKEIKSEFFSDRTSTAWVSEILKDYLAVDLLRDMTLQPIFKRGTYTKYEEIFNNDTKTYEIQAVQKPFRGRPYVFRREDFIREGEIKYPEPGGQAELEMSPPAESAKHPKVIIAAMETEETPF